MTGISVIVNYDDAEYKGIINPQGTADAKIGGRAMQRGGTGDIDILRDKIKRMSVIIYAFENMLRTDTEARDTYIRDTPQNKQNQQLIAAYNSIINKRIETLRRAKLILRRAERAENDVNTSQKNMTTNALAIKKATGANTIIDEGIQLIEKENQAADNALINVANGVQQDQGLHDDLIQLLETHKANKAAAARAMTEPQPAAAAVAQANLPPPPASELPPTLPAVAANEMMMPPPALPDAAFNNGVANNDLALVQSATDRVLGEAYKYQADPITKSDQLEQLNSINAEIDGAASTSDQNLDNIAVRTPATATQPADAQADASLVTQATATQQEDTATAPQLRTNSINNRISQVVPNASQWDKLRKKQKPQDTNVKGKKINPETFSGIVNQAKMKPGTEINSRNSSVGPETNDVDLGVARNGAFQKARLSSKPTPIPLTIGLNDVKLLPVFKSNSATADSAQKTPYVEPAKTIKLTATLKGITHDGILTRNITLKNRLSSFSTASKDGFKNTGALIADKTRKARDAIVDAVSTEKIEEGRYGGKTRNKRQRPGRRITYKNNSNTHPKQSMKKAMNKSTKKATKKATKKSMKKSMKKSTK